MKDFAYKPNEDQQEDVLTLEVLEHTLIVWNDDVNTFDWVIDSLVEICHHDPIQAEQCAFIIHYSGKCDVQSGDFEELTLMKDALHDRGINAQVC